MKIEMQNNAHKGDMTQWTGLERKFVDLEYHKAKLLFAIKEQKKFAIREYIADCANILMSIGIETGVYLLAQENDGLESIMSKDCISIASLQKESTHFIPKDTPRHMQFEPDFPIDSEPYQP